MTQQLTKFEDDLGAIDFLLVKQPLDSSDGIFNAFKARFENHVYHDGKAGRRFLYVPGTREDRVVLVSHADTVWQHSKYEPKHVYGTVFPQCVLADDNVLESSTKKHGIGADDRAGVAMLWQLADLGHSLIITDAEEIGMYGSAYLAGTHTKLLQQIQDEHQFFVQFDRKGEFDFKCYNVGSDAFRAYLTEALPGFSEPNRTSFSDICTLSKEICGVNFSVGYEYEHSYKEYLDLEIWSRNLKIFREWLSGPLPRFKRDPARSYLPMRYDDLKDWRSMTDEEFWNEYDKFCIKEML
jgi:hypothetical protein